jgi:predicted nucleic acid-binding protein
MRINTKDIIAAINEIANVCKLELIGIEVINSALELHNSYNYNYFDCLMLASALNCNCKYILTEDMADKQIVNDTLKIMNIFRDIK